MFIKTPIISLRLNTINLEDLMPSKMNMPEVTKLTSLDSVSAIGKEND